MHKLSYLLLLSLISHQCFSQLTNENREIAITIDDLPLVASKMDTPGNQQRSTERFTKIVQAFAINNVPVTGFVVAGAIAKGQWSFIEQFRDAGFMVGNHTYSHFDLNHMSAEKYIADVDHADKKLAPVLTTPKYFRYPYLAEGNKTTKPKVLAYLAQHNYTVAPVTIDSKDYRFNEQLYHVPYRSREAYINKIKSSYLAFIWAQTLKAEQRAHGQPVKQILLIHANLLNSYVLGDIIQMYKKNGYTFISLTEALKNPAPTLSLPASENESEKNVIPQDAVEHNEDD